MTKSPSAGKRSLLHVFGEIKDKTRANQGRLLRDDANHNEHQRAFSICHFSFMARASLAELT
jgi:hypothetical protein